jgi:hypothetical protein
MPVTDERHDHGETERVEPARAMREAAAAAGAAARATRTPPWLAGAWQIVFVAVMAAIAVGSALRTLVHGTGPWDTVASFFLLGGVALFAVWVAGPLLVWQRARRRGVFPRHDPFVRATTGKAISRPRRVTGTVLIALAAAGIGYWFGVQDSHGGQWALVASCGLSAAAVAVAPWRSRAGCRR